MKPQKQQFSIEFVNHGIANRFSDNRIEVHSKLLRPQFKDLLREILNHEKIHQTGNYGLYDFKLDLRGFKNKELYRYFILTTPSSWLQFLPIYPSKGKIYFDVALLASWGAFLAFVGALSWLLVVHNG